MIVKEVLVLRHTVLVILHHVVDVYHQVLDTFFVLDVEWLEVD